MVSSKNGFSREYSKEVIKNGFVTVNGKKVLKAGAQFPAGADLKISAQPMKYVSRGGYKLEKAVEIFNISLHNKRCMDIGASTGGFTDCMLQNGAREVYAVDSGTAQLSDSLKNDSRVISMEKTNIRELDENLFNEKFDFIAIDVSFISLTLVLAKAASLLDGGGNMVCLIKPQFEVGQAFLNKKGIVKDAKARSVAVKRVEKAAAKYGLKRLGIIESPVTGQDGNVEYLIQLGW